MNRFTVEVDGLPASYLSAGDAGPVVLLLHGTFWSRVWQPVLRSLGERGLRAIAVDLPGLGRSAGELTLETATVPALADWVVRFVAALRIDGPLMIGAHDIGGAIAQHLLVRRKLNVSRIALMNAVVYDSWPVPAVARYRDPQVIASTSPQEIVAQRRLAIEKSLGDAATPALVEAYLEPWHDPRVARSWMAFAGAADNRYTQELETGLRASPVPKLLVWGEDDPFQRVEYAERFAAQMPNTTLVRIPGATHFPAENDPVRVANVLGDFFGGAPLQSSAAT